MKVVFFVTQALIGVTLAACGGVSSKGAGGGLAASGRNCSATKSVLKTEIVNNNSIVDTQTGLLLTTHHAQPLNEAVLETLSKQEVLTQCNASLELLQAEPPRIRLWTASHCVKPLLLTSLTLAIRDASSVSGAFFQWKLDHKLLRDAQAMREVYEFFGSSWEIGKRQHLLKAFDRRSMYADGDTATLTPRVSCENLRWSLQADDRHSLCFSIFDLMHLDFDLPDRDSKKTKALLDFLQKSQKSAVTEQQVDEKRKTFLRRIHLASQVPWIIHEGWQLRNSMTTEAQSNFPFFSQEADLIERLNRAVFSLPHEEEMSFMTPETVTGYDAIPPAANPTYSIAYRGTYVSPRTTISGVELTCMRQLQRYNPLSGKIEAQAGLEIRPREYCYGGSKFSPDHFWDRDRRWSEMVADLTLGAAQDFSKAIFDSSMTTTDSNQRLDRFNIVSTFDLSDELGFRSGLIDLTNPLLKHLQIPLRTVTHEIFGFEGLSESGAFMVSLPKDEVKARFLKGDSGSILMLDGVPVATLYSVDGEETSGGSAITSLPELIEDDDVSSNGGSQKSPTAFKRGDLQPTGCK